MRWLRKLFDVRGEDAVLWSLTAPAAKPRVRILPDGWIRHDGRPFPFAPMTIVELIFSGGDRLVDRNADYARCWPAEMWTERSSSRRFNIRFYRIVSFPREA